MVFFTKRRRAALARCAAKRLARQSTASLPGQTPIVAESGPELQYGLELSIEGELESTIEIDIKQEHLEAGQDEQLMRQHDEVKLELLDLKDTNLAEEGIDPIGEDLDDFDRQLFPENRENQQDIRCQFCLKQFRKDSGRGDITQSKVKFVLGLRKWTTPGTRPTCCDGCLKMFELFYEFKRSCLVALERSAELLMWTGTNNKKGSKFVDSKPKIGKKAKTMKSKRARPTKSKTDDVQLAEEFTGLEEDFKQKILVQTPSTEALSTKQEAEKSSFECENPSTAVTEEEQKKPYCHHCREWFSTKTIYTQHKPYCIKFQAQSEPSLVCSLCPEKFRRQQDLTLHINKHNGVRTIPCRREGCTKMFFNKAVRYKHEQCCGVDAQLICNVCGSLFKTQNGLRHHLDTHEDPKYSCEICNKTFYRRAGIKKHAFTHLEERKFQCKVCGKRFKSYEANRVHQRIHTQVKPYPCHICGQRFMYNCMLKTHLEKGHDE